MFQDISGTKCQKIVTAIGSVVPWIILVACLVDALAVSYRDQGDDEEYSIEFDPHTYYYHSILINSSNYQIRVYS